jgi:hypothetical protein
MRGLHGNRHFDREGMLGGQKDLGSVGAERERDATTARLLALGSQLNGIRDNLTQVLASSHLMIQAAGDIDLELDVSSNPPSSEGIHAASMLLRSAGSPEVLLADVRCTTPLRSTFSPHSSSPNSPRKPIR